MYIKSLQSFAYFQNTLVQRITNGQPIEDFKAYWSWEDLVLDNERLLVQKFYEAMGLTPKTKAFTLWTNNFGEWSKGRVYAPYIALSKEGDLRLFVGFEAFPIVVDNDGTFWLLGAEAGEDTVMHELTAGVSDLARWDGTAYKLLTLIWQVPDSDDIEQTLAFPVWSTKDETKTALYHKWLLMIGKSKKVDELKKLMPEVLGYTQLTQTNFVNLREVLLPAFQKDKAFTPIEIPYSGYIEEPREGFMSYRILNADLSELIAKYGDYTVKYTIKGVHRECKLSEVTYISVASGNSIGNGFGTQNAIAGIPLDTKHRAGKVKVSRPNENLGKMPYGMTVPNTPPSNALKGSAKSGTALPAQALEAIPAQPLEAIPAITSEDFM